MPLIHCYGCGGSYGNVIIRAFAQGCGGDVHLDAYPKYRGGISVVWGLERGAPQIIEQAKAAGEPWIYLDHGYFGRGHPNGYYRVTCNAHQQHWITDRPPDRWQALKIDIKPWRTGRDIVMVPPSPTVQAVFGPYWPPDFKTDRPLQVSVKDGRTFTEKFKNVHALITYNSIAAIEAVVAGVPVFVTGESAALASTDFSLIETPPKPQRQAWAQSLAYGQYTTKEMESGLCWANLDKSSLATTAVKSCPGTS